MKTHSITDGMSLLEIVLGLSILILSLVLLLSLFSASERQTEQSAMRLLVTNRLRELTDGLQSWCISTHFARGRKVGPRTVRIGGDHGFDIEEEVEITPAAQPGLHKIVARARWQERHSRLSSRREEERVRWIADPEWGSRHGLPELVPAEAGEEER